MIKLRFSSWLIFVFTIAGSCQDLLADITPVTTISQYATANVSIREFRGALISCAAGQSVYHRPMFERIAELLEKLHKMQLASGERPFQGIIDRFASQFYKKLLYHGPSRSDCLADGFAGLKQELLAAYDLLKYDKIIGGVAQPAFDIDPVQIDVLCTMLSKYFHGSHVWRVTRNILSSKSFYWTIALGALGAYTLTHIECNYEAANAPGKFPTKFKSNILGTKSIMGVITSGQEVLDKLSFILEKLSKHGTVLGLFRGGYEPKPQDKVTFENGVSLARAVGGLSSFYAKFAIDEVAKSLHFGK